MFFPESQLESLTATMINVIERYMILLYDLVLLSSVILTNNVQPQLQKILKLLWPFYEFNFNHTIGSQALCYITLMT
jgi:predicted nucleotidyltransferase